MEAWCDERIRARVGSQTANRHLDLIEEPLRSPRGLCAIPPEGRAQLIKARG
jgi:hypothetical protein